MASLLFSRSIRPTSDPSDSLNFICRACRRYKSSFRRQRKALRVKPDPAFAPSKTETTDHIIYNPPSSAPNIYHTPLKFLPKTDPRNKFHTLANSINTHGSHGLSLTNVNRLTPVRKPYEKKYHLTPDQVEEMRALRAADPRTWTRVRLAEKFDCSEFFIGICCSSPAMKKEQEEQLELIKRKWGRKKTEAREDRQIRKAMWGIDA